MPRIEQIREETVEFIPETLESGVIYVSHAYSTAAHLCCCGCGKEVVTPLSVADWQVEYSGKGITLSPSVANFGFACNSHYVIRSGRVVWAEQLTAGQIAAVRRRDLRDAQQAIEERREARTLRSRARRFVARIVQWFRDRFG